PGILAGFAAHIGQRLRPDELIELFGNPGGVDEGVAYVDEELECQGEAVAEQAGGDEDAVGAVERDVAMADGLVAEFGSIGGGDQRGFAAAALAKRERDEVVGLSAQRVGNGYRNRLHHAFEVL